MNYRIKNLSKSLMLAVGVLGLVATTTTSCTRGYGCPGTANVDRPAQYVPIQDDAIVADFEAIEVEPIDLTN